MEPIKTLLDRYVAGTGRTGLPEDLKKLYGGDLRFAVCRDRPYVVSNFVSSLDGVVSFAIPGESGGGEISGFDKADRFIMGLLRASADAVMVGSGTLKDTPSQHLWLADHAYPDARDLYAKYRLEVLCKPEPPINVIVSRSGKVDLQKAVFHTPGLSALIITSPAGRDVLEQNAISALESVRVRVIEGPGGRSAPRAILKLLFDEFAVNRLLHEGGPHLLGEFVAQGRVDELFLTLAPQLAGREEKHQRPGLIAGLEFLPVTAPWLNLTSVKQSGEHLYLRYSSRG